MMEQELMEKKKEKLQLDNDTRDLYRRGVIFNEGDWVESTVMGFIGQVHRRGANHLICVTEDGYMFKSFITDVFEDSLTAIKDLDLNQMSTAEVGRVIKEVFEPNKFLDNLNEKVGNERLKVLFTEKELET